jgi:hypothetical protein
MLIGYYSRSSGAVKAMEGDKSVTEEPVNARG